MGSNNDLAEAVERLIDRIDMRINGECLECVIPLSSDFYDDEGVDRNAFVREVLAALREQGFVFGKVYVLRSKEYTRLIYPRPRKPTLHQAAAMLRRQRRAQQRKRGVGDE